MSTTESDSLPGKPECAGSRVPTLTTAIKNGTEDDTQAIVIPGEHWVAWLCSWLGIALSGGAYGFTIGIFLAFEERASATVAFALIALVAGTILAALWAALIVVNVTVLAWITGLSRLRRTSPSFAGACTGMIAAVWLFRESTWGGWMHLLTVVAGVFGAAGGYFPAARYWRKRELAEPDALDRRWQFSLRDLFLRFTVASILLACWVFAIRWFF
jgi:hypothetical protein